MKFLSILIVISIFFLTGCNNTSHINIESIGELGNVYEEMNIPTLMITYDTNNIAIKKGGYSWNTGKEAVTVDAVSPEQITSKMTGNTVLPQSQLTLNFSSVPIEVNIIDWSEKGQNTFTLDHYTITTPTEEGTYIYEVIGKWEQGQVSFIMKLIVSD